MQNYIFAAAGKTIPRHYLAFFNANLLVHKTLSKTYIVAFHQNKFMSDDVRETVLRAVTQSQRCINGLYRLYRRHVIQQSAAINTHDLLYEPIDVSAPHLVIWAPNGYYIITKKECLAIVYNALTNINYEFGLIPSMVYPKNPYTNMSLTRSQLYNAYWKLTDFKARSSKVSSMFSFFFLCDFETDRMAIMFDEYLTKERIRRYVRDHCTNDKLYVYAAYMQDIVNVTCESFRFKMNWDMPIDEAVETLRRPILQFIHYYYSSNVVAKARHMHAVIQLLQAFQRENPSFGRFKPHYTFARWTNDRTMRFVRSNMRPSRGRHFVAATPNRTPALEFVVAD